MPRDTGQAAESLCDREARQAGVWGWGWAWVFVNVNVCVSMGCIVAIKHFITMVCVFIRRQIIKTRRKRRFVKTTK